MTATITASTRRGARASRRSNARRRSISFALLFVGVCVLLYPAAAQWATSVVQTRVGDAYLERVADTPPQERAAALADADAYNAALRTTELSDPFTHLDTANLRDDDPYWDTLLPAPRRVGDVAATPAPAVGVMAQLEIPALDLRLPVAHGTSDAVLDRGIGHLRGTALPVGGPGTHAVLTGHNGIPEAELFSRLDRLTVGDVFTLTVLDEVLAYRVISTDVVLPTETDGLRPVRGRDLVTLITCTPTGVNSHRLLVTGERTTLDAAHGTHVTTGPPFPWWAVILGGVAVAELGALGVLRRRDRRHGRTASATPASGGPTQNSSYSAGS